MSENPIGTSSDRMLVGFYISNYLSFDGRQRFSMVSGTVPSVSERVVPSDGYGIMRMSAVYGANGSGKSNLLRAMKAMRSFVVDNIPPAASGFHGSATGDGMEPVLFDMEIRIGDHAYSYGFDYAVRKQEVVDEWLHEIFVGRESKVLFERRGSIVVHSFEGEGAETVDSCSQDISDTPGRLFLNRAHQCICSDGFGPDALVDVMRWFRYRLRILDSRMLLDAPGGLSESDGTRKLSGLHRSLITMEGDVTFLVDDLDANLHPNAVRRLLDSFLEDGNRCNQLVFTAHNPSLMDSRPLRRDEIWFVEMDAGCASHLYPLCEFEDRGSHSVEKAYLEGRFGAVP